MTERISPYGTWPSPIDAALAASHDGRPDHLGTVGEEVWWTEPRPEEGGRRALVRRRAAGAGDAGAGEPGGAETVLPAPWNVRSRVIEYGGQPWAGAADPAGRPLVVFVHFPDQRLYAYAPDGGDEGFGGAAGAAGPRPLTPVSAVGGGVRWADPVIHLDRGEVWCVLEEFTGEHPTDVRRTIAAVPLDGSAAEDRTAVRELSGFRHRFVTGPRLSPDGTTAAWIAWDHPRMPWDGTEVMTGEVSPADPLTGTPPFTGVRPVAGGTDEAVAQVDWAPDGSLLYVSDPDGWWELRRLAEGSATSTALCPGREEEFGGPLWKLGQRWFQPLTGGSVAVVHGKGTTALGFLDPATGELADVAGPWTQWGASLAAHGDKVVGIAASPWSAAEVVEADPRTREVRVIGSAHRDPVDPAYYSAPRSRVFTGPGGREIHAHVHPPRHPELTAPEGELPPYIIWAHGGPTGHAPLELDLEIAYFTSRGIGVAVVNYGGSTGYGRAYRERLREQWGVVDVEDCAAVAEALAAESTADRARIAVRGGSAGGWTAAASLTGTSVYACGTIIYPVLDLEGWATDETHDFESQYLHSLIGPYAEVPARYRERSPLSHLDRLSAPFLLLQGLDDVICPPVQSARLLERAAGRGVPHAYLGFEGEGHGFRRADTMVRALEAELSLYAQTFGLARTDIPHLELTT
ncbi:prolyl oligopeptidase family serine peptidase [Streptomyces sp. NPDC093085]|uniref:S9 family peptidase n=1 Tax=Streptomyces sp. NPDC093085 TaxID=3155068 RepID=UPI0034204B0A